MNAYAYACIDLEAAFDSIDREALIWLLLPKLGLPVKIISLMKAFNTMLSVSAVTELSQSGSKPHHITLYKGELSPQTCS